MIDAAPAEWIAEIFARFGACFGVTAMDAMFAAVPPEDVRVEWRRGLAGFSSAEISRALDATRSRRFPPNLGEFIQLARPGLDPETAWIEAAEGMREHVAGRAFAWSHPAVFWAAREMQFELRTSSFGACSRRWSALLARSWAAGRWLAVPDPSAKRIPAPAQAEIVPGARAAALERMRKVQERLSTIVSPRRRAASFADEKPEVETPEEEAKRRDRVAREQERIREYAREKGIPL